MIIKLSPDTYLSTKDGVIVTKEQAEQAISKAVLLEKNLTVHDNIQVIKGRDREVVELNLKGLNSNVPSTHGYLVKVYLSGSQGLQQMFKKPIIDPADSSIVRGSYDQYIDLEFDV